MKHGLPCAWCSSFDDCSCPPGGIKKEPHFLEKASEDEGLLVSLIMGNCLLVMSRELTADQCRSILMKLATDESIWSGLNKMKGEFGDVIEKGGQAVADEIKQRPKSRSS